ncbi:MAG: hypothetical protein QXY50_02815 [Candidatus Caldarchaeum sp.]
MAKTIQPVVVGVLLDLLDWIGVGLIPLLADIADLVGVAYFYRLLGPAALAGLLELVPLLDTLPTFTALGIYTYMRGGAR